MRRILFVVIVFALVSVVSFANQNDVYHRIDSIQSLIYKYEQADSLGKAISCIFDLANEYEYNGMWNAYDSVIVIMEKYARQINDRGYIAECYNKIAIANCLRGRNPEAIEYFQKGMEVVIESNDSDRIANFHENIGLVYKDMGKYNLALEHQTECLRYRESFPKHQRLPNSYSNIAQLWEFLGDTVKQWEYLMKAVAADSLLEKDHSRTAILCCEVGEYLMDVSRFDEALEYFQEGLKHCEIVSWQRGIAVFIADMAALHDARGEWEASKKLHQKSLGYSEEIDDCLGASQELNSIAKCYKNLHQLDSAVIFIQRCIEKAIMCDLNFELQDAYEEASDIFEQKGDVIRALEYYKQYHTLNDSLIGIEKHNNMRELETKYETEKKEQQITLLFAENRIKNQRILLFVTTTVVLILLLAFGIFYYLRRKKDNQQRQEQLHQRLLRSQMNPHFLFNALGSIQNYMLINETQKASGYLSNFASLTRAYLEYSSVEQISLTEEIKTLVSYIELERMRLKEQFDYSIGYPKDLETDFIHIPPMLIQPFVENAIKHGFSDMNYPGMLHIQIEDLNDAVRIIVKDNGKGFDHANPSTSDHKSMAVEIFEQRIKNLKKRFKGKVGFKVNSQPGEGTEITLLIPIIDKG